MTESENKPEICPTADESSNLSRATKRLCSCACATVLGPSIWSRICLGVDGFSDGLYGMNECLKLSRATVKPLLGRRFELAGLAIKTR